jgi:hypothetical protein
VRLRVPLWMMVVAVGLLAVGVVVGAAGSAPECTGRAWYLSAAPVGAVVPVWLGLAAAVASLVSAIVRLVLFLRAPGRESRWAAGGRLFFLVFPLLVVLLLGFVVSGFYSAAAGELTKCL